MTARGLELPKLMHFPADHRQRLGIGARELMADAWRRAFPKPKRRRLTFPKKVVQ